eukprot:SAG31_NODE_1823_length_7191_cov_9.623519_3_plen_220_part_00
MATSRCTPPATAAVLVVAACCFCCCCHAVASPMPSPFAPRTSCADAVSSAAATTLRRAQSVCADAPVEEALRSVGVQRDSALRAGPELAKLGLETALDLHLLGEAEAGELLAEARTRGLLTIGERAKLRLLVMGTSNVFPAQSAQLRGDAGTPPSALEEGSVWRREMQSETAGSESLSMDTIAIVLSVLVGAAGYVVQVLCRQSSLRHRMQVALLLVCG